ncbi:succinate dehydrogenase, hydrophobic membrane anchor protein [Candidatus Symbiobacter mobilis]|uniref:Succinate dehydrogenase hydrophobic membrane anchor subunit n=1 Tax=Candidatus Symbiobacter mobilis CR TaxID=946483 RepID=U5NAE8_9BURK|nr:succinate dehydrogenase, hydrophobic membrane anchor protein [Candidatus Symbiobacter mobilis]AGX88526.1 succinate dehydrogenase membrane protein subunit [Candidatus Symbiobacter mobilis CR]
MSINFGHHRLVVGAHYGIRDWLSQRVTSVVMLVFTFLVLGQLLLKSGEIGYELWAGIFSPQWMKSLTFVVILSLLYHVWVGMRNVFMDYVKPYGVRFVMHVFAIVWLVACAGWAIQVLWRL